jgi:hypothetical protein
MKLSTGLVAAALLAVALPVGAQSLGDIAKKEQERRKASPPAVKTYTNEDLKKLPPMASDTGTTPAPAKPADPAKAGDQSKPSDPTAKADSTKKDEAGPAKDEKYWRGRITAAHDEFHRNEMFRDALQTRINSLAADFTARDDPSQRAMIADERQKAIVELARVNSEIEKSNKLIADIEEEARRAGVPPGWLR